MRTTDLRDSSAATGGDVAPAVGDAHGARRLHLADPLRAADRSADLAAARVLAAGTLDGSITSIQAGEHGVLVRHRPHPLHLVAGAS